MRAVSEASFVEAPGGAYVAGPSWIYWCPRAGLQGVSFWGTPRADELDALLRIHAASLRPTQLPHHCIVDTRHLEGLEPDALGVILAYLDRQQEGMRRQVRAQALLRGGGMAGMTLAGLQEVVPLPYPARVFVDPAEALRWLGFVNADEMLAVIEPIIEAARTSAVSLHALRVLLDRSPSTSLAQAARSLEVAPRTLQRRLRESGSSFQAEVTGARVRAAAALLRDPSLTLAAVAQRLGCSSASQFSAMFRRATGKSPTHFRAELRGGGGSRAA